MNCLSRVVLAGLLLMSAQAEATTIQSQVEGPLLSQERVMSTVEGNLEGEIAGLPGLEEGGKYRLFVRVASKHIGPGSWFLYFTEIQLQRRVTDAGTNKRYWALIRSAVLWGTVPSEIEVGEALTTLMRDKVSTWRPR